MFHLKDSERMYKYVDLEMPQQNSIYHRDKRIVMMNHPLMLMVTENRKVQ